MLSICECQIIVLVLYMVYMFIVCASYNWFAVCVWYSVVMLT